MYEAAEALADSTDPDGLRDALGTFDELGAAPMAARVRRSLRKLGLRDLPRGAQATVTAHHPDLTPRQAEVLELLAVGSTDAQIAEHLHLARNTVGAHVSAILRRLGVPSRAAAIHAARDAGFLGGEGP